MFKAYVNAQGPALRHMGSSFRVVLGILLLQYLPVNNGAVCPLDSANHTTFGTDCKYRCNCKTDAEQCDDVTGSCPSGCADGWMGSGCQYRDIAFEQHSRHLDNIPERLWAFRANDGNLSTCSETATANSLTATRRTEPPLWRVYVPRTEVFRGVTIITKQSVLRYFQEFVLYVETSTNKDYHSSYNTRQLCYQHDGLSPLNTSMTVICKQPLVGNQMRIQLAEKISQLVLCDVRVFGGRNLAYSQYSYQSSTHEQKSSDQAVDGSLSTCAGTMWDNKPSWSVDLERIVHIDMIRVIRYNAETMRYFKINTSTNKGSWTLMIENNDYYPEEYYIANIDVRYIQLVKRDNGYLMTCEFMAFGDCVDNKCGLDCGITCHCFMFTFDNKMSGVCPEGCEAGWTGQEDRCDTECPDGRFGFNCNNSCSGHCINGESCDIVSGTCNNGCQPGWVGNMCDAECPNGYFGDNCSQTCSDHCLNGDFCRKSDGVCNGGCQPGWTGGRCDAECKNGTYGQDCSHQCSGHCLDNGVCVKEDGRCLRGCEAGWNEDKCHTACVDGTYGNQCGETCSSYCLDNHSCHKVDGHCPRGCEAGRTGRKCEEECMNGTYGLGCANNCSEHCAGNGHCRQTDGQCVDGCNVGWQGDTCDVAVTAAVQQKASVAAPVAGSIGGVIVLAGILVVIVLIFRRRRNRTKHGYLESTDTDRHLRMQASTPENEYSYATEFTTLEKDKPQKPTETSDNEYSEINEVTLNDGASGTDTVDSMPLYGNMIESADAPVSLPRHGIYISQLMDVLAEQAKSPNKLYNEYQEIPVVVEYPNDEALRSENQRKNRYKKMYPYDYNRVILEQTGTHSRSDYVNASYINGYKRKNAYIAAQGAIKQTMSDIWRIIWQNNISTIVMVTGLFEGGKMKCEKYWDNNGPKTFDEITVTVVSEEQFAEFTIRTFKVKSKHDTQKQLTVTQYHYTAWPDKSCPDGTASLLCFWNRISKDNKKSDTPWLVHCSAGVGRTGTFIALDILMAQAHDVGYVDVYGCVEELRQQRVYMVQTENQYVYLHELLTDALVLQSIPVDVKYFIDQMDVKQMDTAWQRLQASRNMSTSSLYSNTEIETTNLKAGLTEENVSKNRDTSIVPDNKYRPFLSTHVQGSTNYINAVYLPSYRRQHGFILTQTPLSTTTVDWWRLVQEQNICVVVAFNDTGPDEDVGEYLPDVEESTYGPFHVKRETNDEGDTYCQTKYTLTYKKKAHQLTYIQYRGWSASDRVPTDMTSMLQLCLVVLDLCIQHLETPLLIQCRDGATRSGLMAVLLSALDRLRLEEEIAILQIINHLRIRRPQIVTDKEQFNFIHDAIRCHLDEDNTYANV